MSVKPRLAVIGAGRAGSALALALHAAGYPVAAVHSRTAAAAAALAAAVGGTPVPTPAAAARLADWVLVAVPDAAIAAVAEEVAAGGGWRPGQVALHLSGARDASALAAAARAGAAAGSWHPLQTLAEPRAAARSLRGVRFAVEGDPAAVRAATELTHAVGGVPLPLAPGAKPLYHAGAVLASNCVVALAAAAVRTWELAGIPPAEALPALLPLIRGALGNLETLGLPRALTGPIDRGDAETVAAHLAALAAAPDLSALYRLLGQETLRLAEAKGLSPARAEEIRRLLSDRPGPGTDRARTR